MTARPPSEAVTVNPTKIFRSFKKAFGPSIVTILLRLDALEAKGSTHSTLKLCFCYLLVLRLPVGVVNENITIVYVRLVLRHQGGLRPVWSNRRKCLLPDSVLPAKYSQFHTLVDVNPIKLLGYSHDIVVKSQIYAMKFASWHSKGIVKGFS